MPYTQSQAVDKTRAVADALRQHGETVIDEVVADVRAPGAQARIFHPLLVFRFLGQRKSGLRHFKLAAIGVAGDHGDAFAISLAALKIHEPVSVSRILLQHRIIDDQWLDQAEPISVAHVPQAAHACFQQRGAGLSVCTLILYDFIRLGDDLFQKQELEHSRERPQLIQFKRVILLGLVNEQLQRIRVIHRSVRLQVSVGHRHDAGLIIPVVTNDAGQAAEALTRRRDFSDDRTQQPGVLAQLKQRVQHFPWEVGGLRPRIEYGVELVQRLSRGIDATSKGAGPFRLVRNLPGRCDLVSVPPHVIRRKSRLPIGSPGNRLARVGYSVRHKLSLFAAASCVSGNTLSGSWPPASQTSPRNARQAPSAACGFLPPPVCHLPAPQCGRPCERSRNGEK